MDILNNNATSPILFRILSFKGINYYRASLVCKLWRNITYQVRDPSIQNNEALLVACEKNYVESVKMLLRDPRVDPTANHQIAYTLAASLNHWRIVKLLLKDGRVDYTYREEIATRNAIHSLNWKTIEVIKNHKLKKLGKWKNIYVPEYVSYQ
jgi:hypothetical protein